MKITGKKIVYKGNFITIRHDTVEDTTGKSYIREITESREGVLIAAIDDKKIVLIQQSRENHGDVYEVPAGSIENDETPLEAAKRELFEEAGISASKWQLISKHHNGVHDEGYNYYFLAEELTFSQPSQMNDETIKLVKLFSFDDVNTLIQQNKIVDLRNRGCIWLAQLINLHLFRVTI